MPDFANAPKTLRERVVNHLETIIAAMQDDDGTSLWKNVFTGDPDDFDRPPASAPFVSVEEGEETPEYALTNSAVSKILTVTIHIRFRPNQGGVDPFTVFNYYLGRLQTLILTDYRLGGNAIEVEETGSSPQVFAQDRLQGGFLGLAVKYRHIRDNPYQQV